jgi:cobalt-precorrin-5B (C1)-methyltransferase
MIARAVREVTADGLRVEIAIPGGSELAEKTFNPRLGIRGGLSILGTTGIVRPYCTKALHDALRCALDVAAACGVKAPVFVPGNIGAKAARRHFAVRDEQVIEAGNAWGFLLDCAARLTGGKRGQVQFAARPAFGWCPPSGCLAQIGPVPFFDAILFVGHPGKLAKLAAGHWDTHSARSAQAAELVGRLAAEVLGRPAPGVATVEGMLAALPEDERKALSDALARQVRLAAARRIKDQFPAAVFLVNMAGQCLGADGDLSPWR